MRISIVAAGTKMPNWVVDPCNDYLRRMPAECKVSFVEVALEKRSKSQSLAIVKKRETLRLLAAIPANDYIVTLDEKGQSVSTEKLAKKLSQWQMSGKNITLLIGGPDGLDFNVMAEACAGSAKFNRKSPDWKWSLSALTLPHPMVRVLLAEQLYRAWSINTGHPYHRE